MSLEVDDLVIPPEPESPLDPLLDYLQGPYRQRRQEYREKMLTARSLQEKTAVIELGYQTLLFRSEIDTWLAYCGQLLDVARGEQLSVAHGSQPEEGKKHSTEYLKAQAGIFIAPLKRAYGELKDTQDLLNKTLSWCQSQQKFIASEEYGELFSANNQIPEELFSDAPDLDLR
jgi:hypothetical protein